MMLTQYLLIGSVLTDVGLSSFRDQKKNANHVGVVIAAVAGVHLTSSAEDQPLLVVLVNVALDNGGFVIINCHTGGMAFVFYTLRVLHQLMLHQPEGYGNSSAIKRYAVVSKRLYLAINK